MTETQIRNAKRLIRLLENLPDKNFEMLSWFSNRTKINVPWAVSANRLRTWLNSMLDGQKKRCGTAACVGGWAAVLWPKICYPDDKPCLPKFARLLGLERGQAEVVLHEGFAMTAKEKAFQLREMIGLEDYRPKKLF